jgi:hypothetical protein
MSCLLPVLISAALPAGSPSAEGGKLVLECFTGAAKFALVVDLGDRTAMRSDAFDARKFPADISPYLIKWSATHGTLFRYDYTFDRITGQLMQQQYEQRSGRFMGTTNADCKGAKPRY